MEDFTLLIDKVEMNGLKKLILGEKEALKGADATYSPNRQFFYPSQIVPVGVNLNISGTIFSYPFKKKTEKKETKTEKKESSVSKSALAKISIPKMLSAV